MRNIIKEKAQKERSTIKDKKKERKRILTLSDSTHFITTYAQGKTLLLVDLERNPKRKGSGVRDRENPAT